MECVECGRRWNAVPRTGRPRRYCSRSCQGRAYRRRRDQGRLNALTRPAPVDGNSAAAVETAVAMADAEGIATITLRSVALRAGVALRTLQREAGSRDRLVAAMVQHVLSASSPPPTRAEDPIGTLTQLAEHEWTTYQAHPWLVSVMASTRPPLVPAVLRTSGAAIEVFITMGLDSKTALNRYLALSAYVQGMGLLLTAEHQESVRPGTSDHAWWSEEIRQLSRTGETVRHRWLAELADQPQAHAFDANTCFRDGLHRVIPGLVHPAPA